MKILSILSVFFLSGCIVVSTAADIVVGTGELVVDGVSYVGEAGYDAVAGDDEEPSSEESE